MKKTMVLLMAMLIASSAVLSGCSSKTEDSGTPPQDVINPGSVSTGSSEATKDNSANPSNGDISDRDMLEGAVQVSVGQRGGNAYTVDMYNNAAVNTMLGYLSGSPMLFPAYDYDNDQGFVTHSIRGTYTRDDEISVTDIKAGEIYLLSGGQLRLYFMDVEGANITATPVGYFTEADDLTETVNADYEANQGNSWGVDVYFMITKTIE